MALLKAVTLLACIAKLAAAQLPPVAIHSSSWNSTYKLTPEQLNAANLTAAAGDDLNQILNFDRTLLVNGGPSQDDFYTVPQLTGEAIPKRPGVILKIQERTDPTPYSIPPKLAISRIMYTTRNFNGTLIPASAYVLWPYQAKKLKKCRGKQANQAPAVLWTHGTSGFYADGAPSAHRDLFYGNFVPYALAQAGYAVVAPDYAGLGVDKSWDGTRIPHQYLVRDAGAGDALNAMSAALSAFPDRLTENYVVFGHSQGGGVAWGLSEVLARNESDFKDIAKGHLGTAVAAPPTSKDEIVPQVYFPWIGKDLDKIFPDFKLEYWFSELGVDRIKLFNEVQGSQMLSTYLFPPGSPIINPNWNETYDWDRVAKLLVASRLPFKGPMLIVQGTEDPGVDHNTTLASVRATCEKYPGDLEFLSVPGAGHFPALNAAKQHWLQWIEDRHEGRPLSRHSCFESELQSFLPVDSYQAEGTSFPLWAGLPQWFYELPQGH